MGVPQKWIVTENPTKQWMIFRGIRYPYLRKSAHVLSMLENHEILGTLSVVRMGISYRDLKSDGGCCPLTVEMCGAIVNKIRSEIFTGYHAHMLHGAGIFNYITGWFCSGKCW